MNAALIVPVFHCQRTSSSGRGRPAAVRKTKSSCSQELLYSSREMEDVGENTFSQVIVSPVIVDPLGLFFWLMSRACVLWTESRREPYKFG